MKPHNPAYGRSVLMNRSRWLKERIQVGLMLGALEEADASKRKLWLFQSARYRRVWPFVRTDIRRIIEAIERLAEGRATKRDFRTAAVETDESFDSVVGSVMEDDGGAADVAADAFPEVVMDPIHTDNVVFLAEKAAQCDLIRDIFGDPYRPAKADPSWFTPVVVQFARTAYDRQAFAYMPELALALEQAGCDSGPILKHCRRPGEHVRGCWVVDLILGKK